MPKIIHFEIGVEDIRKSMDFYREIFGWKFYKWEGPDEYWMIETGDGCKIEGGIYSPPNQFPKLVNLIDVKEIHNVTEKIKALGGEMLSEVFAVPRVGLVAYFKDPEGVVHGLIEPEGFEENKEAKRHLYEM